MQILCQDVFVKQKRNRYSAEGCRSYDGFKRAAITRHCRCQIFFQYDSPKAGLSDKVP